MRHSLLLGGVLACAAAAFAQVGEISVSGGESRFRGGSPGTEATAPGSAPITIDGGFRLDIRLTLNTFRFFGHEFGYGYSHSTYKLPVSGNVDVPVHSGYYDFLVYPTPEGTRIRPFACGGVGFASFFPPGASVYYGNQITKFGINYGGGLKIKVSSIIGIRFDFRQYNMGYPFQFPNQTGRLLQNAYTGGVAFIF